MQPWTEDELERRLHAIGAELYHVRHPFHRLMVEGRLTRGQMQAWALNRYCYQAAIPRKDARILARLEEPEHRRIWRQRLEDHDGIAGSSGGIARWLQLTQHLGLEPDLVRSETLALPQTRFAVGAYLDFVSSRSLLEAVASSLTELFSPQIIAERVSGILRSYDFVSKDALAYFESRLSEAPRDTEFALSYVKRAARTRADQELVLSALRFKCSVLWAQLDALHFAYVAPGMIPPGAFVPDEH
jgi:pyrroloquinoline-quinone synthase